MTENKSVVKVKDENGWDEALEKESWVAPLVDIYETNDNFYLNANMPGVTRENIKIKMEDGSLVLMGRIDYDEKLNRKYVLKETEMGNFYRKFNISDSIDESKIDAKFENGQLILTLPKQARIKPKTIEIN
ncbi:MAG: Hsp20/alpha crystallin family protein [Melioribacteraceae bacterium]|nr:Hsp20/alpha crystallin family protein [Melioribacteraceae bacterium]